MLFNCKDNFYNLLTVIIVAEQSDTCKFLKDKPTQKFGEKNYVSHPLSPVRDCPRQVSPL